ncbi:MAG: hypothetical protein ABSG17_23885 [Spirochaetia bacterium]|jgi:hypothetical protein
MATTKTRFQAQVEEVLSTFDFDRVHRVMESLAWTWANLDRVPTKAELSAEGRRLLAELGGRPGVLGSGGLRASYKEDGTLSLKFILCESWSDLNEDAEEGAT